MRAEAVVQVNNWNEARKDRKDERFYLARVACRSFRTAELRGALIALQQAQYVLGRAMVESDQGSVPLGDQFPGLLAIDAWADEREGLRLKSVCEVAAMRANRGFLNTRSLNADRYDAYVRFYLVPWAAQFVKVRELVDGALGIDPAK